MSCPASSSPYYPGAGPVQLPAHPQLNFKCPPETRTIASGTTSVVYFLHADILGRGLGLEDGDENTGFLACIADWRQRFGARRKEVLRDSAQAHSARHGSYRHGYGPRPPKQEDVNAIFIVLDELDLSKNCLSDYGARELFRFLLDEKILVRKLKLYQNRIGDFGVYFLAYYLGQQTRFLGVGGSGYFVEELHLSDNFITDNGLRRLLEGLDEASQYPIDDGRGKLWPLWVRINGNLIADAESFVKRMEQVCLARRGHHSPVPGRQGLFRLLHNKKESWNFQHYPSTQWRREDLPIVHFLFAHLQRREAVSYAPNYQPGAQPICRIPDAPTPLPVCPYTPEDRILLIGEGDFSFTKALARMFGPRHAHNLVSTTYDLGGGREAFEKKLSSAKAEVEDMGGVVVDKSVDCTELHVREYISTMPFGPPSSSIWDAHSQQWRMHASTNPTNQRPQHGTQADRRALLPSGWGVVLVGFFGRPSSSLLRFCDSQFPAYGCGAVAGAGQRDRRS